jgi:hypothetical protein
VTGSDKFRSTIIKGLTTLAEKQPWFRQAYNAVAGSSEVNVHIREGSCRRGAGNCAYLVGRSDVYVDISSEGEGVTELNLMNSGGHEFVHAAGMLSHRVNTGIDPQCGGRDRPGNGCIAYYDNLNRNTLGLPVRDDIDGKDYARQKGLPMWRP